MSSLINDLEDIKTAIDDSASIREKVQWWTARENIDLKIKQMVYNKSEQHTVEQGFPKYWRFLILGAITNKEAKGI